MSEVVDPASFEWSDQEWKGRGLEETVLYELHIGTFTPAGTFRAAREKLPALSDLGVTAIELMPVGDFAGSRNWGYDCVAPFAPARCYGPPDDLRGLVNSAHRLGLAVYLDVVYGFFSSDAAYQGLFSPFYFSSVHRGPWGACVNFDGPRSEAVRDYFIENALRWIYEYHIDGLRLDATHSIADDSARNVIASVAGAIHASRKDLGRPAHVIAGGRGDPSRALSSESEGGWDLDALWADDFHYQMRRALAGETDGAIHSPEGASQNIAIVARSGGFFPCGRSSRFKRFFDNGPSGAGLRRFVFRLQDHDLVGNWALGDRLHHAIDAAAYRAASVLLLLLPETPLLFMGQEWAASTPFHYFTDHNPELGRLVQEGRCGDFRRAAVGDRRGACEPIPDPQDIRTFIASRLNWEERGREPYASCLRLYKSLIGLRHAIPSDAPFRIAVLGGNALVIERFFFTVISLRGGEIDLGDFASLARGNPVFSTEDPCYAPDPQPIQVTEESIRFARPGAVIWQAGAT